jgi:hypothetical protein
MGLMMERHMRSLHNLMAAVLLALVVTPAHAQEDAPVGAPTFEEGDVISFDQLDELERFLPPEFWTYRDFFFYEGMRMEIGPAFADYSPPAVYQQATQEYSDQVRLGPESSLENYRAGQPFPIDQIECGSDPEAGAKVAWNFVLRWEGLGGQPVDFYYSYWDRGEELPLFYKGTSQGVALAFRPEPQFDAKDGDLFRGEKRYAAGGPTYDSNHDFGPYGLSFASDRWELRHAIKIRFKPRNEDHPYSYKDIYVDKNTMEPLYSFAYDRKNELWKIIWHNHRWSEDPGYSEYAGWENVPSPRDLTVVSDIIVNVQTGTGNRIEFWNRTGTPLSSLGRVRRLIDAGRLTRGR